jgi:hypothetical protein
MRRAPDCAAVGTEGCFVMTVACSIKLSDEEILNILRRVDEFRQWDQQNKT